MDLPSGFRDAFMGLSWDVFAVGVLPRKVYGISV